MSIALNPEWEKFIDDKDKHEQDRQERIVELRKAIQVGRDQINRGEGIPAEVVFKRLKDKIKKYKDNENR